MIPLGLRGTGYAALKATLLTSHQIRVRAYTLTLSGASDSNLTTHLLDGQVNVDATADVTRSATVSLFDPRRALSFDSKSPTAAALYMDRMLRIYYDVWVPGYGWIEIPVFTGPIVSVDRDGDTLNVEAQGKETLAMGSAWRPMTIRKNTRRTDAIRMILRERAGETNFDIPDLKSTLPKALSLGREDVPWVKAKALAASLGRQLYYDGRGTCRLRIWTTKSCYTFNKEGLLSPLSINYSTDATYNIVWVTGATPKGKKIPISATATAPSTSALSPWNLGRNGVPRYLLNKIEDDHIKTVAEAATVARNHLAAGLMQSVSATFDALPTPHLDPGDPVTAHGDEGSVTFRLTSFSLPLSVANNDAMSVGYLRNVSVRSRHRRHHAAAKAHRTTSHHGTRHHAKARHR